jgi:hypothetical protein
MKSKLSIKASQGAITAPFIPFWVYNGNPVRLARLGDGIHHVYVRFDKNTVAFKRTETAKAKIIPRATWEKVPQILDTRQSLHDISKALKG